MTFSACTIASSAQVSDGFDDGDFSSNPTWTGSTADFKVNNGQLQLSAPAGGTSYLAVKSDWKDTASWDFYFKLDFAPSGSNQLEIYLGYTNADLTADGNGYFLRIGESGNEDNLELYRKTGTSLTQLAEGSLSTLGAGTNEARVRVTRSKQGVFEVSADFAGGNNLILDFKATDDAYSEGAYFGFVCDYTSTRADKFVFDDVRIDPIFKDIVAPELTEIVVLDEKTIQLQFSESLDSVSAVDVSNYLLNSQVPVQAVYNSVNPSVVTLSFSTGLVSGTEYTLTVNGVEDEAGNELKNGSDKFIYFIPEYGDIIINEFYPDPTPSNGLPDAEFVELYNTTAVDIDLTEWEFADGNSASVLPSVILKSNEYLILCPTSGESDYAAYGNTLALALPSLNNSGDQLELRSKRGVLIDGLDYTVDWYDDDEKKGGGYSLERVNQLTLCSGSNNWKASDAAIGGTPGKENSVFDNTPDSRAPQLIEALALDAWNVLLLFDEPIDSVSAIMASYTVIGLGKASKVQMVLNDRQKVRVELANQLELNTFYNIEIEGVEDCEGNTENDTYENAIIYLVPDLPELFDVLITEIFADPEPAYELPAAEYLELQNVSNKILNLADLQLIAGNDIARPDSFILMPGDRVTLCKTSEVSLFEPFGKALGVSSFPGLNNDGELLELRARGGNLIHFVDYSDTWYGSDDKAKGGFSLEMIDTENPCGEVSNWRAADSDTYGSPGQENSRNAVNPDSDAPGLMNVSALDSLHLAITFNEVLDSLSMINKAHYSFAANSQLSVVGFSGNTVPFKNITVELNQALDRNTIYQFNLNDVEDCVGNKAESEFLEFAIPEEPKASSVVINEVLFNPHSGGVDFIELYNRSDEYFELSHMLIANRNDDGELSSIYSLSETAYLLAPGQYVAFSTDKADIESRYFVESPEKLIELMSLPSFPDDEGEVVLLSNDSIIIDELTYDDSWHYTLLDKDEGYSLERIDPNAITQSSANWHSASGSSGGATPTYQNSQFSPGEATGDQIEMPERFSPDNDGFEDVLQIKIKGQEGGQSAAIRIYNLDGQEVRRLVDHDILGIENVYEWDGLNDLGEKVGVGVYILLFEIVNLDEGNTQKFKKTVVVAGQF